MKKRMLGQGLEVSAISVGCMGMTGSTAPSKEDSIKYIHQVLQLGVTMFDTAEAYGPFTNEEIVGEALKGYRNQVIIATKCGMQIKDGQQVLDASPETIRSSLEGSLKRLQTDYVDIYYLHRVDPNTPIEVVAQTMKELKEEGKIRHWGLSEASPETIRKAHTIFPLTAVESEYSMMFREPEEELLDTLEELGIGLVPFSPLGRGVLTGNTNAAYSRGQAANTRFSKENLDANQALVDLIKVVAKEKNGTPAQIALAWLLAQKPFIVPIPGALTIEQFKENVESTNIELTKEEMAKLNQTLSRIEIKGGRYAPGSAQAKRVGG